MKNQVFTGTNTSRRQALCPTTIKAGDPVLLGTVPAVALDDYQAVIGGTTFLLNGTFALTVVGSTTHSPYTGHQINPGDPIYASGSSFTPANGPVVTYNLLLSADSSDVFFGNLDPSYVPVGSGLTDTVAEVKING